MKHELEYIWELFVTRNKRKPGPETTVKDWEDRLKCVHSFRFAEEFWRVYNNLKPPTQLYGRGDFFLFKEGILPEWEHPKNAQGGSWNFASNFPERVDGIWLNTLLSLIGCQYGELMGHICGVEMTVRNKKYRISLWVDTCEEEVIRQIGNFMKRFAGSVKLEFRKHWSSDNLYEV